MSYLTEFLTQIQKRDLRKFLILWEEYTTADTVKSHELISLLEAIKLSDFAKPFGQIAESTLPLWRLVDDTGTSYTILKLIIDLQTTNSPQLAELAVQALQKKYGEQPKFLDFIRLIGLRQKEAFQGAISKYDLLQHLAKGHVVFHAGGWGAGEIVDVSFIREHLTVEFENVTGKKDFSFTNAFKALIPLTSSHFLARRFLQPEALEAEAKEDPVKVIKDLLHDLGPKAAKDIKDELCGVIIPEEEWARWWQQARAKLKRDPLIETPASLKDPFSIRDEALSPEAQFQQKINRETDVQSIIQKIYTFVRDHGEVLKDQSKRIALEEQFNELLRHPSLTQVQRVQIYLIQELFFNLTPEQTGLDKIVKNHTSPDTLVQDIEILALKKRLLILIKEYCQNWGTLFLNSLFLTPNTQLKDYLIKELLHPPYRVLLEQNLEKLLRDPTTSPEFFLWYFQKILDASQETLPFQNATGRQRFFEAFLVLYHNLENQPTHRETLKKMYNLISQQRYAMVRQLLEGTSLATAQEFLLLASKCHSLAQDMKFLRSLAEVIHPTLGKSKQTQSKYQDIIWTTEEGYRKLQERIQQIGTTEMVDNAEEIKAARALGDLRENSEFKFAQERRTRLQSELKMLSDQIQKARIITPDDVSDSQVGIGSIVTVEQIDTKERATYTILGPWDADPEKGILSFHSKLVEAMVGKEVGERFTFRNETFQVIDLGRFL